MCNLMLNHQMNEMVIGSDIDFLDFQKNLHLVLKKNRCKSKMWIQILLFHYWWSTFPLIWQLTFWLFWIFIVIILDCVFLCFDFSCIFLPSFEIIEFHLKSANMNNQFLYFHFLKTWCFKFAQILTFSRWHLVICNETKAYY